MHTVRLTTENNLHPAAEDPAELLVGVGVAQEALRWLMVLLDVKSHPSQRL